MGRVVTGLCPVWAGLSPATTRALLPFLARRTQLQLDRLMRTFLHFECRTIRFLGFQKVGVVPDAVFQVLPGIERVTSRSHAVDGEASLLIGRSDREAVGE